MCAQSIDHSAVNTTLLLAGNEQEMVRWFRVYEQPMTAYVKKKIASSADVQELVQNVFLACLESLPLFRHQSSLWTWMCSFARHEIADYYRKKYAKRVITHIPFIESLLPEQLIDMHDVSQAVLCALATLSAKERELLQLKYVDKKSVKAIAKLFRVSVKSMESSLYRARKAFEAAYAA